MKFPHPQKGEIDVIIDATHKVGGCYNGYPFPGGVYYELERFPGYWHHSSDFRPIDDLENYRETVEKLNLVEIAWKELEKIEI